MKFAEKGNYYDTDKMELLVSLEEKFEGLNLFTDYYEDLKEVSNYYYSNDGKFFKNVLYYNGYLSFKEYVKKFFGKNYKKEYKFEKQEIYFKTIEEIVNELLKEEKVDIAERLSERFLVKK